jgi:hypothetical protein
MVRIGAARYLFSKRSLEKPDALAHPHIMPGIAIGGEPGIEIAPGHGQSVTEV